MPVTSDAHSPRITLVIDWRAAAADLPPELQEQQTQALYRTLQQLAEVERIPDPNAPDGSMGMKWLTDLLLTKVLPGNFGDIFNAIRQRLPGTPVNFEISVEGKAGRKRQVSMTGVRPEDFDAALDKLIQAAKELSGE